MHKEHDERAKLIAEQALDRLGEVQREVEIPTTDALRFDLSLKRRRVLEEVLPSYLALLAVVFDRDCMIEVFSSAVTLSEFWDSQLKQLAWRRMMQNRVREQPAPQAVMLPSRLWIISAGRPEAVFARYALHARQEAGAGVYEVGQGMDIGVVVVSELPCTRETLLLRLMGPLSVCRQALKEVRAMEDADPEAPELRRLIAYLRHTLGRATNKVSDEEYEALMTSTWAEFERYEQEIKQRFEEKGMKKALSEAIMDMCGLLGIEVSEERRAQLEGMELEQLRALKDRLVRTRTWTL